MSENYKSPIGSLKDALEGTYEMDIKSILKEAWEITRTTKQPLLQALLIIFLIAFLIVTLIGLIMGSDFQPMENPEHNLVINIVTTVLVSPLVAGLMMMGIRHAIGEMCQVSDVFAYLTRSAMIAIASLLVTAFIEPWLCPFCRAWYLFNGCYVVYISINYRKKSKCHYKQLLLQSKQ